MNAVFFFCIVTSEILQKFLYLRSRTILNCAVNTYLQFKHLPSLFIKLDPYQMVIGASVMKDNTEHERDFSIRFWSAYIVEYGGEVKQRLPTAKIFPVPVVIF